jgi:hypothetical protein
MDTASHRARADLGHVLSAASQYHAQYRVYPSELAALAAFGLSEQLASGVDDGYRFSIVSATPSIFLAEATPAAPGKTGLDTCTIDQAGAMRCAATGPAVIAEKIMFLRIAALAATTVSNLVLHPEAPVATESEIKGHLARGSTVDEVFATFDTNHDGTVTFSKIFTRGEPIPGGALGAELSQFLLVVQRELALGAGNEHVLTLPGVPRSALPRHYCSEDGEREDEHARFCPIFPDPEAQRSIRSE